MKEEDRIYDREQMMEYLAKTYPGMFLKPSEEFGKEWTGGIWTTAEPGPMNGPDHECGGLPIFDYWSTTDLYDIGVLCSVVAEFQDHGWYCEWYDGGTMMIWPAGMEM